MVLTTTSTDNTSTDNTSIQQIILQLIIPQLIIPQRRHQIIGRIYGFSDVFIREYCHDWKMISCDGKSGYLKDLVWILPTLK
ncbi:unnamed protein product [Rhizophagus irregularis]|nr:unnamed protein product [Rhizophagus irregularis]